MSVIEFGCGAGNGLIDAEMHIAEMRKIFPVEIELYGFDAGSGLPPAQDYRDFPHYFRPGLYSMDRSALEQKLKIAKLVIGDVKDTCKTFFADYNPAPIGCVFHDLDFYSSTKAALTLFDIESAYLLPRIFMYFDDVGGDNTWLVSEFAGEPLAIDEFNRVHRSKKIAANRWLPLENPDQWWTRQVFIHHDFEHPDYNTFIAGPEQEKHQAAIRLGGDYA